MFSRIKAVFAGRRRAIIPLRVSRAGGNPVCLFDDFEEFSALAAWIPACAGMTVG
jgi:hypothetical protein